MKKETCMGESKFILSNKIHNIDSMDWSYKIQKAFSAFTCECQEQRGKQTKE